MKITGARVAINQIESAKALRLFLDYDGTLADFAPTPDDILPDDDLIDLLSRLVGLPDVDVSVISGRRLEHILHLLPIDGILTAGTYGIEIRTPSGSRFDRLDINQVRPILIELKPRWQKLIDHREGFYLEDKNWSLALHARFASELAAQDVIEQAHKISLDLLPDDTFRIMGGDKFLEVAPRIANKGNTIDYLLSQSPLGTALPVYIGDDDKDEEAFVRILKHGGIAIKVGSKPDQTVAQLRLNTPQDVREWLQALLPDTNI